MVTVTDNLFKHELQKSPAPLAYDEVKAAMIAFELAGEDRERRALLKPPLWAVWKLRLSRCTNVVERDFPLALRILRATQLKRKQLYDCGVTQSDWGTDHTMWLRDFKTQSKIKLSLSASSLIATAFMPQ